MVHKSWKMECGVYHCLNHALVNMVSIQNAQLVNRRHNVNGSLMHNKLSRFDTAGNIKVEEKKDGETNINEDYSYFWDGKNRNNDTKC